MRALSLAAALALAGCAVLHPRPSDPGLFLLPPSEAGFTGALVQRVQLHRGETTFDALASAEVTPTLLKLAVLSPLGNRMLGLVWDGKKLEQERAPGVPKRFPAEIILRDLQLTFWPAASVERALPSGWTLQDQGSVRTLRDGDKPAIVIHYGPSRLSDAIEFANEAVGYSLTITPLQQDGAR